MTKILPLIVLCLVPAFVRAAEADTTLIVHEVVVQGNERTKEYVIRREMTLAPGVPLTQEAMDGDRDRIYNLLLFNKVSVDYAMHADSVIVYVTVDERWYVFPYPIFGIRNRDARDVYYGAGLADVNFRGRNEKLYSSVAFGYDRWISLNYVNPKISDDDLSLTSSILLQRVHSLNPNDVSYEDTHLAGWLGIGKRFGLFQAASFTVGYEVWQVSEPGLGRTASPAGRDAYVSLLAGYAYDTRNNREYATAGSLVMFSLLKSGLGGQDVDITTAVADARTFVPLWEGAGVGFREMMKVAWGGFVPPYLQSQFGYDDRVRGHFSEKVQAENITLSSVELRIPLLLPRYFVADFIGIPQFEQLRYGVYAAIFADAGRVWNRTEQVARGWRSGAGAGLHFLLPYGFTIRTEAAVNDRGQGEGFVDFGVSF